MGVYEREQPDLDLVEDIQSTKTIVKGYEYTYEKNEKENKKNLNQKFDLSTSFGLKYGPEEYTGQIYASDIGYSDNTTNDDKLEVYATYKIMLRNMSTNLYNRVNEIVSYYDERYDQITEIKEDSGTTLNENIDYKIESSDKDGYKKLVINKAQNVGKDNKLIYITYRLSDSAIHTLLEDDVELNPTMTEIISYSTFSNNSYNKYYAGIDKDSNPGNAELKNVDTYEDDTDFAAAFKINLREREIRGTVWEDERRAVDRDPNEKIGNGKYDANENTVQNVKVELYEIINGNLGVEPITLFIYNEGNNSIDSTKKAITKTNVQGDYMFKGIPPGIYIVKYTYGNLVEYKSIIYNHDGREIGEVNANKYKSTIFRGGSKSPIPQRWYAEETSKNSSAERLSDAVDNYTIRNFRISDNNEINYSTAMQINDGQGNITAKTNNIPVNIEYDGNENAKTESGKRLTTVSFDQIDFGISERPKQFINISKEVTKIEVILANGQTIISGNPQTEEIKYLKRMPDGNIQIEIDKELIQGATLNVEYTITADPDKTETDYLYDDYYVYGILPPSEDLKESKIRKIHIARLFDYISNYVVPDENMILQEGESNPEKKWKKVVIKSTQRGVDFSEVAYDEIKKYNYVLETNEFKEINPTEGKKSVTFRASKILSYDEEMNFDNDVEINQLTGTILENSIPGNYIPPRDSAEEDGDNAYVTITPPTGKIDIDIIELVSIIVSALITIGVGIIFIKKKVL